MKSSVLRNLVNVKTSAPIDIDSSLSNHLTISRVVEISNLSLLLFIETRNPALGSNKLAVKGWIFKSDGKSSCFHCAFEIDARINRKRIILNNKFAFPIYHFESDFSK